MSRYVGVQRVIHLDAVVMEVRVGQELIGGVVHVRGQELTHKVAVDVRLGRHVVGEAKQIIPAHVSTDSHCVNEVRSDFCDVQVAKEITNKADGRAEIFGGQNFVFGKKMYRENTNKKQSLSHEGRGHGGLIHQLTVWRFLCWRVQYQEVQWEYKLFSRFEITFHGMHTVNHLAGDSSCVELGNFKSKSNTHKSPSH